MQPFAHIHCPYCGEPQDVAIDESVPAQEYYEDCQVCCKAILLSVEVDPEGAAHVQARSEDEA